MIHLLGSGVFVMIAACAAVGVRLVWLWTGTRQLPELAFGLAFLLFGALGYPLSIAARTADAGALLGAALAAQDLGALAIYLATWRTFRAGEAWSGAFCAMAGAAFAASLAGQLESGGFSDAHGGGAWYYLGLAARALGFVWTAVESGTYYLLLRRRGAVGLADPVVTDRVRLWAVTSSAISAGFALFLWGRLATPNVAESPVVLAGTSVAGVVGGVSMWLAFFPPAAYLRRVRARAPAAR